MEHDYIKGIITAKAVSVYALSNTPVDNILGVSTVLKKYYFDKSWHKDAVYKHSRI